MARIKIDKVVSVLPDPLVANTIYAVRVGNGFDLVVTDATGTTAHTLNSKIDWAYLSDNVEYTDVETEITGGVVFDCTLGGNTYYRYISTAESVNGYPIEDSFYFDFTGGVLSNKIAQRGE